jgi:hypothetical protein
MVDGEIKKKSVMSWTIQNKKIVIKMTWIKYE